MIYPEVLQKLINYLKKLPGIGEKSAERLALSILDFESDDIEGFSEILLMVDTDMKKCSICGHITDNEICSICDNSRRDKNLICIIEDYKSVFAFEKAGNYNGVYHVLGGLISPVNNISPDKLSFEKLKQRINSLENPEIIIALKSSIEGETTTLYIKKIFENSPVVISRLSYGIPIGSDLDYLDVATLDRALEDRKKISE
ncbi:MAG: recombination mediator RecR [bacterium]